MSRSYKKNPILKVINKGAKAQANRYIRRSCDDVPNGNVYRRYYPQYDVCDQWYRTPWEERRDEFDSHLARFLAGEKWASDPRSNDGWRSSEYYTYGYWYKMYKAK